MVVIGLGSNLLVRDGGVPGVVVRLGRGFAQIEVEPGHRLRAGAVVPDAKLARAAADAGIAGLAFYRGVPGSVGGALRMNAGAHGRETREVLVEARAVDRDGNDPRAAARGDAAHLPPLRRRRTTGSSPRRCSRAAPASRPRS